jgi:hypothetical protein
VDRARGIFFPHYRCATAAWFSQALPLNKFVCNNVITALTPCQNVFQTEGFVEGFVIKKSKIKTKNYNLTSKSRAHFPAFCF